MVADSRKEELKSKVARLQHEVQELSTSRLANFEGLEAIASRLGFKSGNDSILKTRRVLKGHFGKVYSMSWAGSGKELVSASQDGKLIVWDAMLDAKIHAIPLRSSWVMTCAYEQMNDQFVACGGLDNLCSIYKLNHEGEPINRTHRELAGHDGYLSSCRFIGPEKILTASGDSSCILWDIETGSALLKFEGHEQDVMALHVQAHVNPYTFVSGSCDCSAKVWDTRSGRCTMTLQGHSNDINAVSLFQDCHTFASGGDDSTIRVFDLRSVAEVKCFSSESILCGVTSLDVSKSGRFVFGGYDDYNCYKWDVLGSGQKVAQVMSGHENRVSCVAVNPLGNAVCTGSWDASLKIWA